MAPVSSRIALVIAVAGWAIALLGVLYALWFVSGDVIHKDNLIYTNRLIVQMLVCAVGFVLCAGTLLASAFLLLIRRDDRMLWLTLCLSILYILVMMGIRLKMYGG